MSKLNTNQDLILDLMNFSKFGPLSEVFIMNAVQEQAQQVIREFEANPPARGEHMPMFDPEAWYGVAKEIKERCDAFYCRGRSQPEPEVTVVAAAIRNLHEHSPDDYPDAECFDVIFKTSDGRIFYSDDLFSTVESAQTLIDEVGADFEQVDGLGQVVFKPDDPDSVYARALALLNADVLEKTLAGAKPEGPPLVNF